MIEGRPTSSLVFVPSQCVLSSESGRDGALLKGVVDGVWGSEVLLQDNVHASHHLGEEEVVAEAVCGAFGLLIPSLGSRQTVALWWRTGGGGGP